MSRSKASPKTTDKPVLTIRLFARYAELFGSDVLEIPATGIETVGDLLAALRKHPIGAAVAGTALVAVNLKQARSRDPISPQDEVALLPPLAGG